LRDTTTGAIAQLAGTDGCISENGTNGTCVNGVALDFPTSIAISPKGDHVYVASVGSNAVAIFSRDKTTGVLTQLAGTNGCVSEDGTAGQCAIGRGLLGAFSVAVASDGGHVYVAARDSNAIAAFGRDKQTGILTQLEGTSGCVSEDGTGGECADGKALLAPLSVTIAKNGRNLYVASSVSNALAAFSRDKKTGVLTQLEGTNGCVSEDGTGGECANGQSLVEASGVLVTRNGRSAYVASATSDAVAAFARE
jgi:DNA-binding beta-propeller fold protein YncE